MKKSIMLIVMLLFVGLISADGELGTPLSLNVSYTDPTKPTTPILRIPPVRLSIFQNGHTLNFRNLNANYALTINDNDNNQIYTTHVVLGSKSCILPYNLNGTYIIKLSSSYCSYWGFIDL